MAMANFGEIVGRSLVCLDMRQEDGQEVMSRLIEEAAERGLLAREHLEEAARAVFNRERSASTAMPDGIALPHGRTECVREIICVVGIHRAGVEFGAPDGLPTQIFVLLLVPATVGCSHIHFLANLSRRLLEGSVRQALLAAETREQVLAALAGVSVGGGVA